MTEYYRQEVKNLFLNGEIINKYFAGNLLSWRNSGFSIDNSVQILTDKAKINLSEYISRTPVSLKKLKYWLFKGRVLYHTQYNKYFGENVHMFSGCDFTAELTRAAWPGSNPKDCDQARISLQKESITYAGMSYMPREPKGNGFNIQRSQDMRQKAGRQLKRPRPVMKRCLMNLNAIFQAGIRNESYRCHSGCF